MAGRARVRARAGGEHGGARRGMVGRGRPPLSDERERMWLPDSETRRRGKKKKRLVRGGDS